MYLPSNTVHSVHFIVCLILFNWDGHSCRDSFRKIAKWGRKLMVEKFVGGGSITSLVTTLHAMQVPRKGGGEAANPPLPPPSPNKALSWMVSLLGLCFLNDHTSVE